MFCDSAGADEFDNIVCALGMDDVVSTLGHSEFLLKRDNFPRRFGRSAIGVSHQSGTVPNLSDRRSILFARWLDAPVAPGKAEYRFSEFSEWMPRSIPCRTDPRRALPRDGYPRRLSVHRGHAFVVRVVLFSLAR